MLTMYYCYYLYPFLLALNLSQCCPKVFALPLGVRVRQLLVDEEDLAVADVSEYLGALCLSIAQ